MHEVCVDCLPGEKVVHAGPRQNNGTDDQQAVAHRFGAEGRLGGEKVVLLKPETFMNRSGQSVGEAARFYKVDPAEIVVFHDEIDLAPGKLRVKQGGGHAGHNGLRSVHAHIGDGYGRVRMGIGHPGHKDAVPGYVLKDFPKADMDWLDDMLRGVSDGASALAGGDTGRFQNAVALRLNPPRSSKTAVPAAQPAHREPEPESEDTRSPLQRLVDRFR